MCDMFRLSLVRLVSLGNVDTVLVKFAELKSRQLEILIKIN